MKKETRERLLRLEKDVAAAQRLNLDLARAFFQHARVDAAPDSCLPALKVLVKEAERQARKRPK